MKIEDKFIEEAILLELNISHLYDIYSAMFIADSKFWSKMSKEKKMYAFVIDMLRSKFIENIDYCINTPNVVLLKDLNRRLEAYVAYAQSNTLSRREAFRNAMKIEHLAYDGQFRDVLYSLNIAGIKDIFSIVIEKGKKQQVELMRYMRENYV